ncbi:hypothetical protein XENORESO_005166 [Xenotaenia resolanae]|uniref:IBB domain-containing protein n=1 Tax=Xenotaenia resolanae TaxID=208358 RepID=A0ABV0WPU2_9TELE
MSQGKDNARLKSYKNKSLNTDEMRRRREEEGLQLRKQKKDEQVSDLFCSIKTELTQLIYRTYFAFILVELFYVATTNFSVFYWEFIGWIELQNMLKPQYQWVQNCKGLMQHWIFNFTGY